MYSKYLSAAAVALAASGLVSAQTHSDCNPVKGDKNCPKMHAVGGTVTVDFTKGDHSYFEAADGTDLKYDDGNGAVCSIDKDTDAPTIIANKWIFFGRVDVEAMAAPGKGIVTSVVLQSQCLDEIDWEWLGADTAQVQTNYFSKGDDSTYDRGGFSPVASPQKTFHTYSIDWTDKKVDWIIDGKVVRTLTYEAAKGGSTYPQTPMQVKLGTWVAGRKNAPKGTVEWSGGYANFGEAPFKGFYRKVTVQDYSNGVKGATSYEYTDTSGTFKSIKVHTGEADDDDKNSESDSSSSSSKASPTGKSSNSTATTVSTATKTGSGSSATGKSGSGASGASTGAGSKPTTATTNAAVQSVANFAAMGAAVFLTYLVL